MLNHLKQPVADKVVRIWCRYPSIRLLKNCYNLLLFTLRSCPSASAAINQECVVLYYAELLPRQSPCDCQTSIRPARHQFSNVRRVTCDAPKVLTPAVWRGVCSPKNYRGRDRPRVGKVRGNFKILNMMFWVLSKKWPICYSNCEVTAILDFCPVIPGGAVLHR